jgi:hypothetical protein
MERIVTYDLDEFLIQEREKGNNHPLMWDSIANIVKTLIGEGETKIRVKHYFLEAIYSKVGDRYIAEPEDAHSLLGYLNPQRKAELKPSITTHGIDPFGAHC